MKSNPPIILLLLFFLLLIPTNSIHLLQAVETSDFSPFCGYASCIMADGRVTDAIADTPQVAEKCNCINGQVKSGDGLISMPCQCGPNCKCPKTGTVCPRCGKVHPQKIQYKGSACMTFDKPTYFTYYLGASYCPPCKLMKQELNKLKDEGWKIVLDQWETDANIVIIDIEKNPEIAIKYDVASIPCLVVVRSDEKLDKKVGYQRKLDIASFHNDTINADKAK